LSEPGFIPPHGNYRKLASYQRAEAIYDLTFMFCKRFLGRGDRTIDQMVQAARSGKQNIVEGCQASGTSKETEVKLLNVARASLEELLNDYQDFLRVRAMTQWAKDSKEALFVRRLATQANESNASHETHETHQTHSPFDPYRPFVETRPADVVANIAICLIHQANFLLDRQIRAAEQEFLRKGGIRERMTRTRLDARRGQMRHPPE
jgi:four helix bundle suffix protein